MQDKMSIDQFKVITIERIFNELFADSENTILASGGSEPIYLPYTETGNVNKIVSTKDYFSSALHEVSHWCVAGLERRKLIDYGYWYEPDGRNAEQQRLFEHVEVKPQALEWIFTMATGKPFRLSADNINQPEVGASDQFRQNVYKQALHYIQHQLPERAGVFLEALLINFQPEKTRLSVDDFKLELLK